MGHTDSPGLGGATINTATQAEIISCVQLQRSSNEVHFTNADSAAFPPFALPAPLLLHAGAAIDAQLAQHTAPPTLPSDTPAQRGAAAASAAAASSPASPSKPPPPHAVAAALLGAAAAASASAAQDEHSAAMHALCSRRDWQAYAFAALAVLCSSVFPHADDVKRALQGGVEGGAGGLRIHIAALGLPSTGGVSSSAALTGAISMGLQAVLGAAHWPRAAHASVDMAEYLLGKTAGAADKTAQLFAAPDSAVVVGSFPEAYLRNVSIPSEHIAVFMVQTDLPRITTTAGKQWLQQQLSPQHAGAVHRWGAGVMQSCGARAYELAAQHIQTALAQGGLTPPLTQEEHAAVCVALFGTPDTAQVASAPPPLLRELASGGGLAAALPDTAQRHGIVYRLLAAVPPTAEADGVLHWPRAAALYGVSECERGGVYEDAMGRLAQTKGVEGGDAQAALGTVLRCVATAHDGDRALWDAWGEGGAGGCAASEQLRLHAPGDGKHVQGGSDIPGTWTAWAHRSAAGEVAAAHVSDAQLAEWARDPPSHPLQWKAGSFQRSLPQIDAAADALAQAFPGAAAMRVAAAGLGGFVAVHCAASAAPAVREWLVQRGWAPRAVQPGAPTGVLGVGPLAQLLQQCA